jgi:hypothetical protein
MMEPSAIRLGYIDSSILCRYLYILVDWATIRRRTAALSKYLPERHREVCGWAGLSVRSYMMSVYRRLENRQQMKRMDFS